MIRRPPKSTLFPNTTLSRSTVTDPNGAALPGVTVEIRNVETNTANTATTNEEGAYAFPLLQPGRYTLTATADRKSTRLNSSHANISYAVFCLKKKTNYYYLY